MSIRGWQIWLWGKRIVWIWTKYFSADDSECLWCWMQDMSRYCLPLMEMVRTIVAALAKVQHMGRLSPRPFITILQRRLESKLCFWGWLGWWFFKAAVKQIQRPAICFDLFPRTDLHFPLFADPMIWERVFDTGANDLHIFTHLGGFVLWSWNIWSS